jgi:hypothetical protein
MTGQSESSRAVQPAGQHLSPPTQAVIGVATQTALQVAAEPCRTIFVQSGAGGQAVVGQEPSIASSHVSTGDSTIPLPHTAGQSASTMRLPPGGQQPSPATNAVTGR